MTGMISNNSKVISCLLVGFFISVFAQAQNVRRHSKIDRLNLVTRHNPTLHQVDPFSPFTIGNGSFAFTADITGLQSFQDYYNQKGIPLETLSDWCWHSSPNPNGYSLKDASKVYLVDGKEILYPTEQNTSAGKWLRRNPHRQPLGKIGFEIKKKGGSVVTIDEIANISQTLDLWTGALSSLFSVEEEKVIVKTICHPELNLVAVNVSSKLILSGQMQLVIEFPYSYDLEVKNKPALDWSKPDLHTTNILTQVKQRVVIKRMIDSTEYCTTIQWRGNCSFIKRGKHRFILMPAGNDAILQFAVAFSKNNPNIQLPTFDITSKASASEWKKYWITGGAIDFSGSTDLRANELERRVILSQYLLRAQSCGRFPPQESGLTHNSWYGKHHTEMIWWHTAHFALWNHPELLAKNLNWYISNLPVAQQTAKDRGLEGARWSKMIGPDGRESPGNNPFIIWNQPNPIYLAELLYRTTDSKYILKKYKELVLESAACMASMVTWDSAQNRYVLGPPLWHAQETYNPLTSQNPTFELAYWAFGLEVAEKWLERMGLKRNDKWDYIIKKISQPPIRDGLYVGLESSPTTFSDLANEIDHPSMLMAYGFLPGMNIDKSIMRNTIQRVVNTWKWEEKIWGWDYPMIAMTAARLGEPELAVDILLKDSPRNHYTLNGNCPQTSDLPVYLPANGALLSAVALMVAGWDGNTAQTPGFPNDGTWKIKYENLQRLP
jgi:hypothetical protein